MTDRATRELVALMVAGTVCLIVVGSGLALVILKLATPEIDIGPAGQTWASMVGILFGLTVGYLVGKREP